MCIRDSPNRFNGLLSHCNDEFDEDDINVVEHTSECINPSESRNVSNQSNTNYRPHIIIQDYPENNFIKQKTKPGINDYNEAVKYGKTTVVFSTSLTKGINVRHFNEVYKIGTARFRRFHSAKARHIKHYVLPTLIEEKPTVVLLQCGGNDLQTSKANPIAVKINQSRTTFLKPLKFANIMAVKIFSSLALLQENVDTWTNEELS